MTDRGVQIGEGPFQPPAFSELDKLRGENAELRQRLSVIGHDIARNRAPINMTGDLVTLIQDRLEADGVDIRVDDTIDHEGNPAVRVVLRGVQLDGEEIVSNEQTFEVAFELNLSGSIEISARSADDADDAVSDALGDLALEAERLAEDLSSAWFDNAEVQDVSVHTADMDHRFV